MEKEKVKKVKVGDQFVEVTLSTREIYKITLIYAGGISKEEFYRSFRDKDDAYRYCIEIADKKLCSNFFWQLIDVVDFNLIDLMEE